MLADKKTPFLDSEISILLKTNSENLNFATVINEFYHI